MTFDQLATLLESTKGQIRAFDNKAQVLLGVNGVLIGFITAEIAKAAEYGANGIQKRFLVICIALTAAFLSSCVSMGVALFVINPQLHMSQPTSKLFFCHLARDYGRNYTRAAEDLAALDGHTAILDVGTQIQANALICDVKSLRCLRAMRCAGIAFAFYALSVPIFCSMAFDATRRPFMSGPVLPVACMHQSPEAPLPVKGSMQVGPPSSRPNPDSEQTLECHRSFADISRQSNRQPLG